MIKEMLTDQIFRIKGLAGKTDSIEAVITAFYDGGIPSETRKADFSRRECAINGLSIVIGGDVLDIGKSFRGNINGFLLEINGKAYGIDRLGLQYAVCGAAELLNADFYPHYEKLNYDKLRFTLDNDRFIIETPGAAEAELSFKSALPELCTLDDVAGDIRADLILLSYYPDSRGREEIEAALNKLLAQAEEASGKDGMAAELDALKKKTEEMIAGYINSSAEHFKGSGKHLLEKTAGSGR